ncbi:MAG: HAMP domain-containing histidine kinase [Planctomycetes bacterium]|nr:HAMP domain-containing histidine kinase [Planctomycetota bacterium]
MIRLGALTAAMLAAGGAAVWCLLMLQSLNGVTREEFEELREIRPIERVMWNAAIHLTSGDRATASADLDSVREGLRDFAEEQQTGFSRLSAEHAASEQNRARLTIKAIETLRSYLEPDKPPAPAEEARLLASARNDLNLLIDEFEAGVAQIHVRTTHRFQVVLIALVIGFVVVTVGAAVVSYTHYRSVIRPLRYVRDGVRTLARGALATRLEPRGDAEFTDLQNDFNTMAGELESLYRNLEQRVADQGRRLAVSERLASVGFLAAGVAHEINNPLAIMAGHAQSALRRARQPGNSIDADVTRDLEIIRDEAFRAKEITQQLLDLSGGRDPQQSRVSLRAVIDDVAGILRDTPLCSGKAIQSTGERVDPLLVNGSEPELKQVVINLTMNAAHAVAPDRGLIELRARRANGWIELDVRDNGCGMTPETLEHVFEPFFTHRKGRGGIGLGLTISHAIIERHGGELSAASDGPGRGSVFTMRLPAFGGGAA